MRSYTIDSLTPEDCKKLADYFTAKNLQGSLAGIFWLPVPENFLNAAQREHDKQCGPHVMALELEGDCVRLEFLVRAKNALHCSCVSYAAPELEQHMMRMLDDTCAQLSIGI